MATKNLPAWFKPASLEWGIRKAGVQFSGPFNGTGQAVEFVAERWTLGIALPPRQRADAGRVEALLNWLCGGVNRLRVYHLGSGSQTDAGTPRGTMRGLPVLAAAAVRGNATLSLANCGAGATLQAGDMIGCNQLFQIADDATADGAGAMTVNLVNRVRAATATGTAVVWSKPVADFALPAQTSVHAHVPAILMGASFDLEETW